MRRISLGALSAAILLVACRADAAEPLPAGPNAYTVARYQADRLAYLRKSLAEAYRQFGHSDKAWDGTVLRLMEESAIRESGVPGERLSIEEVLALVDKAIAAGCKDPAMFSVQGFYLDLAKQPRKAMNAVAQGLKEMDSSGHPRLRRYFLLRQHWTFAHRVNDASGRISRAALPEAMVEAICDDFIQRPQARFLWNGMRNTFDSFSADEQKLVVERILSSDKGDAWLKRVAAGEYYVDEAWRQRSGSWASLVNDSQWAGFHRYLDEARETLTEAWEMEKGFPEAAAAMISVAMAKPMRDETPRLWFDRTVAAQLDWMPAYEKYLWSLRPRWGGSHDEMYAFGVECARTGRYDTEVPRQLVKALMSIQEDDDGGWSFLQGRGVYAQLRDTTDGIVAAELQLKNLLRVKWYRAYQLATAFKIDNFVEAQRILATPSIEFDEALLSYYGLSLNTIKATVSAETGPYREKVVAAQQSLTANGDLDGAIGIYQSIVADNKDPASQTVFQARLAILTAQRDLLAGETITLPTDAAMTGWTAVRGSWKKNSDGKIAGRVDNRGNAVIFAPVVAGPRFEIEATIPAVIGANDYQCAGFCVGARSPSGDVQWTTLDWQPALRHAAMMAKFDNSYADYRRTVAKLPATIRLQVWDGRLTAYIGDALVFADYPSAFAKDQSPLIGLGGESSVSNVDLVYSDVKVRMLTEQPKSDATRFQRLVDHAYYLTDRGETERALQLFAKEPPLEKSKQLQGDAEFVRRSIANRGRVDANKPVNVLETFTDSKDWRGSGSNWELKEGVLTGKAIQGSIRLELALDLADFELSFYAEWEAPEDAEDDVIPVIEIAFGNRPGRHHSVVTHNPAGALTFQLRTPSAKKPTFIRKAILVESEVELTLRKRGDTFELIKGGFPIASGSYLPYRKSSSGSVAFVVRADKPGATVSFSDVVLKALPTEE